MSTSNAQRPMFPNTFDSTILSTFRACPQKFYWQYLQHWKSRSPSVHLIAGGAFASGIEAARNAFYVEGLPAADAEAIGLSALLKHYGDFVDESGSAKSPERMAGALEFYFSQYPLGADGANPITLASGRRGIEFSFAEPLGIAHPVTGDPILYTGRSDMIAERAEGIYIYDEKTTSSLGASWGRQWEMRCFSPEHEVLTRSGWKSLSALQATEEVMQSDAEGNMDFTIPTAFHSYDYEGDMISIEGRRLSQLITPNHRVLLQKRRGGTATVLAEHLALYDAQAKIPLGGRHSEERLAPVLQRFLVAVQADARLSSSKGEVTSGQGHREHMPNRAIEFKFTKERKILRLRALLAELKAEYTENVELGTIRISGFSLLSEVVDTFLDGQKEFKSGHESWYGDAFLDELQYWDGWESQYYTKSKKNAEFVVSVAALNDRAASMTYNTRDNYTVVLSRDVGRSMKTTAITTIPYSGLVCCLTVPTGYLLIRHNGCISLSGNSQFTGYVWAAAKQGIKTNGAIVRGVSILKTKYDTLEVCTYRGQHELDRWEKQTLRDITRAIAMWKDGYWDSNLDGSCNDYGGCAFTRICKSREPADWLPINFEQRVWDPLARIETTVAEYEASWGHVRTDGSVAATATMTPDDDGDALIAELDRMRGR